jgi:hypothetical protein
LSMTFPSTVWKPNCRCTFCNHHNVTAHWLVKKLTILHLHDSEFDMALFESKLFTSRLRVFYFWKNSRESMFVTKFRLTFLSWGLINNTRFEFFLLCRGKHS